MPEWWEAWAVSIHRKHTLPLPIFNANQYSPENIPHLSQQQSQSSVPTTGSIGGGPGTPQLHPTVSHGQSGSPVKEASILQRGMSVDEQDGEEIAKEAKEAAEAGEEKGIPIRKS